MLRPAWADDDGRNRRMRERPGEGERAHALVAPLGFLPEPVEPGEDTLVFEAPVALGPLCHARARRVALAPPVLAGQPPARERAEGLVADAVLDAQRKQLLVVVGGEERERVL